MNTTELFFTAARQYPNTPALLEGSAEILYADLAQEVQGTASYFASKGIREGDRVLVAVPMSIDLYRVVLALLYLGATAVFIDEWAGMERLNMCCRIAECKAIICGMKARFIALFSKELRKVPIHLSLRGRSRKSMSMNDVPPETPALITFTTGSTGVPKAANRTHDFLQKQYNALLEELLPHPNDRCLCTLPIIPFIHLGVGCTTILPGKIGASPSTRRLRGIADEIEHKQATKLIVSPNFLTLLARQVLHDSRSLLLLERIFTGGAPVFPNDAELYERAFPAAETTVFYGSTEAEPISSIRASDLHTRRHELSHGLPVGSIAREATVRIIRITPEPIPSLPKEEFNQLILPDGVIGEIIVSGDHVLKNYFKNPEAFAQNKIRVGQEVWHRTSDSGFLQGNQLYLTGRCKQIISWNSELILPFLIEYTLQRIDGIEKGTILEIHRQLVVIVQSKLSRADIEHALNDLPTHTLIILPRIPVDKRHNSKIDYDVLRDMVINRKLVVL